MIHTPHRIVQRARPITQVKLPFWGNLWGFIAKIFTLHKRWWKDYWGIRLRPIKINIIASERSRDSHNTTYTNKSGTTFKEYRARVNRPAPLSLSSKFGWRQRRVNRPEPPPSPIRAEDKRPSLTMAPRVHYAYATVRKSTALFELRIQLSTALKRFPKLSLSKTHGSGLPQNMNLFRVQKNP